MKIGSPKSCKSRHTHIHTHTPWGEGDTWEKKKRQMDKKISISQN